MPIPAFTTDGLLPPGMHPCTLDEVQERFGRFRLGDNRRYDLINRLTKFLREVKESGIVSWVVVDGSFVTAKEDPGDIDLVLVLRADHDYRAALRPFEYNAISRRRIAKRYEFDVLVAREGSPTLDEYLVYFQAVKGSPGKTKGLLRVAA